ncbi:hypothetical protein RB195_013372 [Necator americanus]|uniref:Uncharacterized protein n=1 Tax=Necator americanus TaxID=51031 RepID=A0ABR1DVD0_NECAM
MRDRGPLGVWMVDRAGGVSQIRIDTNHDHRRRPPQPSPSSQPSPPLSCLIRAAASVLSKDSYASDTRVSGYEGDAYE